LTTPLKFAAGILLVLSAQAFAADNAPVRNWDTIRTSLFQDRAIEKPEGGWLQLEAPGRVEDAAVVPIAIHVKQEQTPGRYVQRLYLIADKNPSPIAAVFRLTPDSGLADIETRIRLEEYTQVRAIAETNDGHLYMANHIVKAIGGCSAPPPEDHAESVVNLGRMKIRLDGGEAHLNQPNGVQLIISHPNNSGLVMDQVTRFYVPAFFVRQVQVNYADQPILSADVDFSISQNPSFHFYFVPRKPGTLTADVTDSSDGHYRQVLEVTPN
jgi:sulfur-oxidizing protein SoxY